MLVGERGKNLEAKEKSALLSCVVLYLFLKSCYFNSERYYKHICKLQLTAWINTEIVYLVITSKYK
jgi:hypothetical protein